MSPIHTLPVELLTRIFQIGVDAESTPSNRDPNRPTFEVLISHVCRHWRQVAIHTPHLWTVLHFRTKAHIHRGEVYLSRNPRLLINIHVDTCSEDVHNLRQDLIFRDEFLPTFDILVPHIGRWREFHLKCADLGTKGYARKVLSTCGSAPKLETLQLWHVQNWRTPERLFNALGPLPVVVFDGKLPSLKHIQLQGVNLPWDRSPFLKNLTTIDFALHSDDVRMPFELWRNMLLGSPGLERMLLHYSGPRARSSGAFPPDGIEWWGADPPPPDYVLTPGAMLAPSVSPVELLRLREIEFHDLDSDYLVGLLKTIHAPNVRSLHLELETDEQDFSPLVTFLAVPPVPKAHQEQAQVNGAAGPSSHRAPAPKFPALECLCIDTLECSVESWRELLMNARKLTRLEVDFTRMREDAFDVLFESIPEKPATDVTPNGVGAARKGKARAADEHEHEREENSIPILPSLHTLRLMGMPSHRLAELAAHRRARGYRIRRWEVEESSKDDMAAFKLALERESARWRTEEGARDAREGQRRDPWRWDEPAEMLDWYKDGGLVDDDGDAFDDEDEDDGEESGEGDGEGEEEREADQGEEE